MSLWSAPVRVAAELAPGAWTFAAAERKRDARPKLIAARTIAATGAALGDDIRAFRRAAKLPMEVSVILWPHAGDDGVVPIASRDSADVTVPAARVVRERVAPLVRAGGLVTEVLLPHECLAALAASRGESSACVIVAHPGMTCVGVVTGGAVRARYLSSLAPPAHFNTESARLLARYQHVSLLAPHVRELGGAAGGIRVLVAGQLPSLRAAMVPLVEELDHEIDILDGDLPKPGSNLLESADADQVASVQLAWAAASMTGGLAASAPAPGAPG